MYNEATRAAISSARKYNIRMIGFLLIVQELLRNRGINLRVKYRRLCVAGMQASAKARVLDATREYRPINDIACVSERG